jgi:hypothetical protein
LLSSKLEVNVRREVGVSNGEQRRRKTRTREHVIADLGVNYVERYVLLAGFTAERIANDYGIDLYVTTFNALGEVENGNIAVQVKSTDHPNVLADGSGIVVRVATVDVKYWLFEWDPVMLVLYDATKEQAFWLDVQEYAARHELDEEVGGQTISLRLPTTNMLDVSVMQRWRTRLDQVRIRQRKPPQADPTEEQ